MDAMSMLKVRTAATLLRQTADSLGREDAEVFREVAASVVALRDAYERLQGNWADLPSQESQTAVRARELQALLQDRIDMCERLAARVASRDEQVVALLKQRDALGKKLSDAQAAVRKANRARRGKKLA